MYACKIIQGIQHKIHGKFNSVWDASKVNLSILRENTEGLYYGALQDLGKKYW